MAASSESSPRVKVLVLDGASLAPSAPEPTALSPGRRALICAGVIAYFIVGFRAAAALAPGAQLHTLRTFLDDAIPFAPWTVWIYSWVYTSALYPAFVVRSGVLFLRAALAYAIVLTASFTMFVLYPVTSIGLRPDPSLLDDSTIAGWGLHLTYVVDPPFNLFPSLHLGVATIAALSAYRASRILGLMAAPVVIGIAITICTTKQHYIADGLAAFVLALGVYRFVLWRDDGLPSSEEERSYGWRGALLYLGFHGLVYAGFIVAFHLGLRAW